MGVHGAALGKLAFLVLLAVGGVGLPSARPCRAQDGPLVKLKELNRQAIADYAAEDYESAQLGLREAIALGQRAGLAHEPLMARLHANLGAVYINGLKDPKRGTRALETALSIEPAIKLTDTMVTPELREIFAQIQARLAKKEGPGAPPPSTSTSPGDGPPAASPAPADPPSAPAQAASPPAESPSAGPPAGSARGGRPPAALAPAASPPAPAASAPAAPAPPAAAPGSPSRSAPAEVASAPATPPTAPVPDASPAPAKVAVAPARRPTRRRGPEEPDLPARVPQPVYCPTPDEAPPSEKITLNCVLQPAVSASKVLLYYRVPGAEHFTSASTVRSSKGWYRGVIPADVVQGRSLHYYVEARDATNEVVGSAGRDDSPNVVLIREGAVPVAGTGLFAGVRFRPKPGSEAVASEEDPLEAVSRDRERERDAQGLRRRRDGALFFGVGLGSGYGYHRTQRLEFYREAVIEQGWIPSGMLHLAPEVGYQVGSTFAISVLARLQVISQTGSGDMRVGNPARSAFAVLARPQLLFGPRNVQLNLSGYLGGGDGFRLTVPPQLPKFRRNDSVRGGPLVAGAGLGVLFHLTSHVALAADTRWLFGFPDFAGVADLALGMQLGF
jgi:hypothetical protein